MRLLITVATLALFTGCLTDVDELSQAGNGSGSGSGSSCSGESTHTEDPPPAPAPSGTGSGSGSAHVTEPASGPDHDGDTVIHEDIWDAETREDVYGQDVDSGLGTIVSCTTGQIWECLVCMCYGAKSEDIEEAAAKCRALDNVADRVACASREAKKLRTGDCKDLAGTFNDIIDRVSVTSDPDEPDIFNGITSWYTPLDREGHVYNWVRWEENGVVYTYAVDAGWFPGELYPWDEQSVPAPSE